MRRELSVKDIFWFCCQRRNMFQSLVLAASTAGMSLPRHQWVVLCLSCVLASVCVFVLWVTENALQHSSKWRKCIKNTTLYHTHAPTYRERKDIQRNRVNHRHHHHHHHDWGHERTSTHAGIGGSYGCQDECHINAAPKTVSKRHQRRFSPSAVKLQTENRTSTVVIRMNYELCSHP